MSGSSVESLSMADGGTGLGFAHVAVSAVYTEYTGLNFIQVVTSHAQLGLQQVDIRLITAFLHRHTHKVVMNVCRTHRRCIQKHRILRIILALRHLR